MVFNKSNFHEKKEKNYKQKENGNGKKPYIDFLP